MPTAISVYANTLLPAQKRQKAAAVAMLKAQDENFAEDSQGAESSIESSRWITGLLLALTCCVGMVVVFVIRQINGLLRKSVVELAESAVQIASAASQVAASSQSLAQGAPSRRQPSKRPPARARRSTRWRAAPRRTRGLRRRAVTRLTGGIREDQSVAARDGRAQWTASTRPARRYPRSSR